jgi:uncharacterized protein (TIGR04222 family)
MNNMNQQESILWQRLQSYAFDALGATTPITLQISQRLRKERGWTYAFATRAIREYTKFAFLATISDTPVTPSETVDEVWHAHLLYTEEYWGNFCPNVLGTPLHHTPGEGKSQEKAHFAGQYDKTIELYKAHFGDPPTDIWRTTPTVENKTEKGDNNKSLTIAIVGSVALTVLEPFIANPYTVIGPAFLGLYGIALTVAFGVALYVSHQMRLGKMVAEMPRLDTESLAYLASGSEHAGLPTLARLLERGVLRQDGKERVTTALNLPDDSPQWEQMMHSIVQIDGRVPQVLRRFRAQSGAVRTGLEAQDLVLTASKITNIHFFSSLPLWIAFAFGIIKIAIGASAGRPVGYLIALCALTFATALYFACRPLFRTKAGDAVREMFQASSFPTTTERVALRGWEAFPATYGLSVAGIAAIIARQRVAEANGRKDTDSGSGGTGVYIATGCSSGAGDGGSGGGDGGSGGGDGGGSSCSGGSSCGGGGGCGG